MASHFNVSVYTTQYYAASVTDPPADVLRGAFSDLWFNQPTVSTSVVEISKCSAVRTHKQTEERKSPQAAVVGTANKRQTEGGVERVPPPTPIAVTGSQPPVAGHRFQ